MITNSGFTNKKNEEDDSLDSLTDILIAGAGLESLNDDNVSRGDDDSMSGGGGLLWNYC